MLVIGINPGDGVMCPWLTNVATNFKHYKINKMTVMYDSSVSSFTNGAIAIAPTYDPDEIGGQPLGISEIMTREGAVKGNIWDNFKVPIKPMTLNKLVRSKALTSVTGEHLRQTDHALLHIALYNIEEYQDVNAFGDLLVTYDITLLTPSGSRANSKCHLIDTPVHTYGNSSVYGPLFAITEDALDHTIELDNDRPFYNHLASLVGKGASTLGIRCHTTNVGSNGPNTVQANRFVFDEPFTGRLQLQGTHDAASGSYGPLVIKPGALVGGSSFNYYSAKRPLSAASVSSLVPTTTATTTGFNAFVDIVAKAGDVLDLAMAANEAWTNAKRHLSWTQLAPELIEAAGLV